MEGRAQQPGDFATAFEAAFGRLQILLETACTEEGPWSNRAVTAIRRGLAFAAAEPELANVLTNEALAHGVDGVERYERLMSYLGGLLEAGREERPHGAELPVTTERSLAGGVAAIVANRIDRGRVEELPYLTLEVAQFVLTPYLGTDEARRIAAMAYWPPGQADR